MSDLIFYSKLLTDIRQRITQAQAKAVMSANAELIALYWDIGKMLIEKQQQAGWGAGVIPRLSRDIHNELPEIKGFSERNIGRMIAFYREYSNIEVILPQAVAKLPGQSVFYGIPWGHHILLIEKISDLSVRFWYMEQTVQNGWTRDTLIAMIKNQSHARQGKLTNNFDKTLPQQQSHFAEYALRDIHKPIGVSEYEFTRALPDNLKSSLPSIEEIEAELNQLREGE